MRYRVVILRDELNRDDGGRPVKVWDTVAGSTFLLREARLGPSFLRLDVNPRVSDPDGLSSRVWLETDDIRGV